MHAVMETRRHHQSVALWRCCGKPLAALIAAFEQSGLALSSDQLSHQLLVILAPRAGAKFGWKKEISTFPLSPGTSFVETMCAKTLPVDGCVMTWHRKSTVIVETSLRVPCASSLSPISGTVISKWNAKVPFIWKESVGLLSNGSVLFPPWSRGLSKIFCFCQEISRFSHYTLKFWRSGRTLFVSTENHK